MTSDAFEDARNAIDRAADLAGGARRQIEDFRLENHQLKRRLKEAQQQVRAGNDRIVALEQQVADAQRDAEMSKRAMLAHAARTN